MTRGGRSFRNPLSPFELPQPLPPEELEKLVIQLRNGTLSREQYEQIYFGHVRLAIALSCRIGFSVPHLASDIVGEALLGLAEGLEKAPTVLTDNNVTAYLSVILRGRIIDFIESQHIMKARTYRHKKKKNEHVAGPFLNFLSQSYERVGVYQPQIIEIMEAIEYCINRDANLNRREYKRAIVRLKASGYSSSEVAGILDISETYVSTLLKTVHTQYNKIGISDGRDQHFSFPKSSEIHLKKINELRGESLVDDAQGD